MGDRERQLRREDLLDDPIRQFAAWYEHAQAEGIPFPEACALATASRGGHPSARMVLMKHVDERGFVFATSYTSRKGRDLDENPRAALLFHWHPVGRQVRVEGPVEPISAGESDAIFLERPRDSRISALASRQSEPLVLRDQLEARVRELGTELEGREVERPSFWGGYRVKPEAIEFWQHRANRLHIRFLYRRDGDGWTIGQLQP
jgi:pyridoxamine 5'-phosphate oxidase